MRRDKPARGAKCEFRTVKGAFNCEAGAEDGFAPNGSDQSCCPHGSDYNRAASWSIDLTELLRVMQSFNSGRYTWCPDQGTEDGYCLGLS